MSIFKKKIDEITIDDVESFIAEKHPENIRLEYKREFSESDTNKQIAKEVSAFANQYGGVIIFGIEEEEDKTRNPKAIIGIDKSLNPRSKIQSVCIDHIYPPIAPDIQECEIKGDNTKVVIIVRVDMSDEAPHTINKKAGFYIRTQDRSDPREMTSDEIELLWNRRAKVIERREWLLKRAYNRILGDSPRRDSMRTPLILRAIPLFPLAPLTERTKLFNIYGKSVVSGSQGVPLTTDHIKTSSDSIYAHFVGLDADNTYRREEYGELNIYGQVTYIENARQHWGEIKGVIIDEQLRQILIIMKFLAKWYRQLGYWGIIKFSLEVENLKTAQFYMSHVVNRANREYDTALIDNNMKIERQFSVSELIDNPEAIATDIFKEYLWNCGQSVHNTDSIAIGTWIDAIKSNIGSGPCLKCKKAVYAVDEICKECKLNECEKSEKQKNEN